MNEYNPKFLNVDELFDTSNVPQSHTVSENDNLKKFQNKGMYDITEYEDYILIHMPNYDWKISYESAEILKSKDCLKEMEI